MAHLRSRRRIGAHRAPRPRPRRLGRLHAGRRDRGPERGARARVRRRPRRTPPKLRVRRQHPYGPQDDRVRRRGRSPGPAAPSSSRTGRSASSSCTRRTPTSASGCASVRGVQSAGATRTSPLTAAGTTEEGEGEAAPVEGRGQGLKRSAAPGAEPMEADQWDLRAIGADKAAKINPGSKKVTVAVIDTGVDDTHPDLAANFSRLAVRELRRRQGRTPPPAPGARRSRTTTTARMWPVR